MRYRLLHIPTALYWHWNDHSQALLKSGSVSNILHGYGYYINVIRTDRAFVLSPVNYGNSILSTAHEFEIVEVEDD